MIDRFNNHAHCSSKTASIRRSTLQNTVLSKISHSIPQVPRLETMTRKTTAASLCMPNGETVLLDLCCGQPKIPQCIACA
jgi:hypothetical protein